MEFILASSNKHKVEELNKLFENSKVNIQVAPEKIEVVEDGATFQENAFKKAKAYFDEFKIPSLADDSGLVLPIRADILGVRSARYAPELSSYVDKNKKLIDELKDVQDIDRGAYFVCYFCFYISEEEVYFFEGRVHGQIGHKIQGDEGFGYDPIFLPDGQNGKSMAEVLEWKMSHSHRAKACKEAIKFFENYK